MLKSIYYQEGSSDAHHAIMAFVNKVLLPFFANVSPFDRLNSGVSRCADLDRCYDTEMFQGFVFDIWATRYCWANHGGWYYVSATVPDANGACSLRSAKILYFFVHQVYVPAAQFPSNKHEFPSHLLAHLPIYHTKPLPSSKGCMLPCTLILWRDHDAYQPGSSCHLLYPSTQNQNDILLVAFHLN